MMSVGKCAMLFDLCICSSMQWRSGLTAWQSAMVTVAIAVVLQLISVLSLQSLQVKSTVDSVIADYQSILATPGSIAVQLV